MTIKTSVGDVGAGTAVVDLTFGGASGGEKAVSAAVGTTGDEGGVVCRGGVIVIASSAVA